MALVLVLVELLAQAAIRDGTESSPCYSQLPHCLQVDEICPTWGDDIWLHSGGNCWRFGLKNESMGLVTDQFESRGMMSLLAADWLLLSLL